MQHVMKESISALFLFGLSVSATVFASDLANKPLLQAQREGSVAIELSCAEKNVSQDIRNRFAKEAILAEKYQELLQPLQQQHATACRELQTQQAAELSQLKRYQCINGLIIGTGAVMCIVAGTFYTAYSC